jgi:hypothetical protein
MSLQTEAPKTTAHLRLGVCAHDSESMVVLHQRSHIYGKSNLGHAVLMLHKLLNSLSLVGRKLRQRIAASNVMSRRLVGRRHVQFASASAAANASAFTNMFRQSPRNPRRHSRDRYNQYQCTVKTKQSLDSHLSSSRSKRRTKKRLF